MSQSTTHKRKRTKTPALQLTPDQLFDLCASFSLCTNGAPKAQIAKERALLLSMNRAGG